MLTVSDSGGGLVWHFTDKASGTNEVVGTMRESAQDDGQVSISALIPAAALPASSQRHYKSTQVAVTFTLSETADRLDVEPQKGSSTSFDATRPLASYGRERRAMWRSAS